MKVHETYIVNVLLFLVGIQITRLKQQFRFNGDEKFQLNSRMVEIHGKNLNSNQYMPLTHTFHSQKGISANFVFSNNQFIFFSVHLKASILSSWHLVTICGACHLIHV